MRRREGVVAIDVPERRQRQPRTPDRSPPRPCGSACSPAAARRPPAARPPPPPPPARRSPAAKATGWPSAASSAGSSHLQAHLRHDLALRPVEMRQQHRLAALAEDVLDRRHDALDPRRVGDPAVLDRHVDVDPGQHDLAFEVHVVERLPAHRPPSRLGRPQSSPPAFSATASAVIPKCWIEVLDLARGPEARHPHEPRLLLRPALAEEPAVPAEAHRRLDRHAHRPRRQHAAAVLLVLRREQLLAGHRHHPRPDPLRLQRGRAHPARSRPPTRWRSGSPAAAPRPRPAHRRPRAVRFCRECFVRTVRRFCRVSASTDGVRSLASASSHASAVSTVSAGRKTFRFGVARSIARCSTGWCVGPSSPSPIESCVKHIDDPHPHQRREPRSPRAHSPRSRGTCRHRGSPRHAPRSRSSPPPSRARGCRSGCTARRGSRRRTTPSPLVSVLFDPVRSADPPSVSGTLAFTTSSTSSDDFRVATFAAASDCAFLNAISAPASFFGSAPETTRSNSARFPAGSFATRSSQAARAAAAARPDRPPLGPHLLRHLERRPRPAVDLADRCDLLRPERRAVRRLGVLLRRRPEADMRPAGDHRRPVGRLRLGQRPVDVVRIVPVALVHRPARGREPRLLVGHVGEAHLAVDRDPVVVPHHDQPPRAAACPRARSPRG